MTKNPKRGFKAAKNYEPGRGKTAGGRPGAKSATKPGSKSPKHRGYRVEEDAPKKSRWNADDRAARSERGGRSERSRYDRDDRPRYDRDDRAPRRDRDDRPRYDRDDRYDRQDRPRYDRDDRAPRRDREDRPRYDRDDRAPRRDRDDRPRYDRDDRNSRDARGSRYDRPRTERNDRPRRDREEHHSRAARGDRPDWAPRSERAPRRDNPQHDRVERRSARYFDERGSERFTPADDAVLERLEAQMTATGDVSDVSFADLGLGDNLVRALADLGASSPFPIQAATIPDVLSGHDVLGRGRTGSGKTIAFGAALVERLLRTKPKNTKTDEAPAEKPERGKRQGGKRQMGRNPRALILAPTRELALQIDRTVQPLAQSVGLFTTQIYGGVPQARQVGALQRGVDIIIGTPGRMEDLIAQGHLNLRDVEIAVLDEADHMCDLGFLEPVQNLLRAVRHDAQHLLFSATLDQGVAALVKEFLNEPRVHEVAGEDQASGTIDHRALLVNREDKLEVIRQLVDRPGKVLVFSRTRAYAEMLADDLDDVGIPSVSLHGDLNQARRTRNLEKLTKGRVNVLVATDVAARGIHVDDIDLVVQADPPDEYKTYLHRAGRTGRAGKSGTVVTIVPRNKQRKMRELLQRAEIEADLISFEPGDEL